MIETLETDQQELTKCRDTYRVFDSPARRLPIEIWAEIMSVASEEAGKNSPPGVCDCASVQVGQSGFGRYW